uniref:Uncharacterized protein n=1 Tax=Lactuca sativa TaxID=4236 RepID=A0A9R1UZB6_LACSA|nr:hypothetical protein LSAT_V11C700380000 [Lactuca sativa]
MLEVDENPHLLVHDSDVNPKDLRPPQALRPSPSLAFLSSTVTRKAAERDCVGFLPNFLLNRRTWRGSIDLLTFCIQISGPELEQIHQKMEDKFTMQEGKRVGVWKNIARGRAALTLPLTASFPNVSITSQLFFLIMKFPTFSLVETL